MQDDAHTPAPLVRTEKYLRHPGRRSQVPQQLLDDQVMWSCVTKSISCSTGVSSPRSRSDQLVTVAEDPLPGAGDVGLVAMWPARAPRRCRASMSVPRGTSGHADSPNASWLDRLPDVDERVPGHQHVRAVPAPGDGGGDPGLLATRHQVIGQHAQSAPAFRPEVGHDVGEVVDAVHELDHHADVPQVVAPDLLHQLGVVPALDVDPAGQATFAFSRGPATDPDAVRLGDRPAAPRPDPGWRLHRDRLALEQEPVPDRKAAALVARPSSTTRPFSQRVTAPQKPVVASSSNHARAPGDLGHDLLRLLLPAGGENVGGVAVRGRVGRRRDAVLGRHRRSVGGVSLCASMARGSSDCRRMARGARRCCAWVASRMGRMATLAMFPLGTVLLPYMPLRLRVFEQRYLIMLEQLLKSGRRSSAWC